METDAIFDMLGDILSFDRPVTKEKMVAEARDFLNAVGYPVGNDSRSKDAPGVREFVEYVGWLEKKKS